MFTAKPQILNQMKYPHLTSLLIVLLIGLGFGCSRTQPETVK